MSCFEIEGCQKLNGILKVPCSKNAYLPILAGCILCDDEIVLHKAPAYTDVNNMCEILSMLGAKITKQDNSLIINAKTISKNVIPHNLSGQLRSSIFSIGAILGRLKEATVAYPGGCEIGARPIDLHIKGLKALGAKIEDKYGQIKCDGKVMQGGVVHLDFPSVGATENIIMGAVLTEGETKILNPAREVEVVDLVNFLNKMGAKIYGAGTNEIVIFGVKKLKGTEYTPIPDRIYAGSMLIASAMCGGQIILQNAESKHLEALLLNIKSKTCKIETTNNEIKITSKGSPKAIAKIETMPYPGFPTDLQPQIMSMLSIANGTSILTENLFENRFRHVGELGKMGADIYVKDRTAIIKGTNRLYGASVQATDLRGGVALTLAGLVAEGKTRVAGVEFIDRGYEKLEKDFANLGAKIKRI